MIPKVRVTVSDKLRECNPPLQGVGGLPKGLFCIDRVLVQVALDKSHKERSDAQPDYGGE